LQQIDQARKKEVVMADSYILFDIPGSKEPIDRSFLESIGQGVVVCHGPEHGELCPILAGKNCPLAEGAHGIVFEFDLARPQHRAILRKYREVLRSDLPIRVVATREQEIEHADLLRGLRIVDHRPVAGDLDALASEVEASDSFV
jgi:hypothetical protein